MSVQFVSSGLLCPVHFVSLDIKSSLFGNKNKRILIFMQFYTNENVVMSIILHLCQNFALDFTMKL